MSDVTTPRSIHGGSARAASGIAALVMAFALGGCFATAPTCPAGKVPVVSTATYAAYVNSTGQYQVENVTNVKDRCMVPVTEKPAGNGSTSQATSCSAGMSKLAMNTVWGTYYDGKDVGRHADDTATVNDRCIVEINQAITSPCPPGTHAVLLGGKTYCVPN